MVNILEHAHGASDGEFADNIPEDQLREEMNYRTWKAGYTNREGGYNGREHIGSRRYTKQGARNYERIFGHG